MKIDPVACVRTGVIQKTAVIRYAADVFPEYRSLLLKLVEAESIADVQRIRKEWK